MMRTVTHAGVNKHLIITLHGTGGSADSLFSLGQHLDPNATYVGVEGEVLENGMRRYFERYPDGSFKLKSLAKETYKLYDTILNIIEKYKGYTVTVLGYSNGANIALNILKEFEKVPVDYALLFHPSPVRPDVMFKEQKPMKVYITSGDNDPFISEEQFKTLAKELKEVSLLTTYTHEYGHQLIQEELDIAKKVYGD